MPRIRTTPALLALLALAATSASRAAPAEDCLAGPNAQAPQGSHWYYRLDRTTHRKCWYIGAQHAQRAPHRRAAEHAETTAAGSDDDAPAPEMPSARPPQTGIVAAPPDPGFGARAVEEPPRATADAAPDSPAAAPPAPAALPPERIAPRAVATTTERGRTPAPAKPPETAPPAAAAAVPAPANQARGALPAALFGVALLLAAVGTMLVRARRRMIRVHGVARSMNAGAAPGSRRARRTLSDILAQAERGEPESAAAREASFFERIRGGLTTSGRSPDESEPRYHRHFVPAPGYAANDAVAADIATATLQPAIEEITPEPIEPEPDVEQSLRQLLAAWERRAA